MAVMNGTDTLASTDLGPRLRAMRAARGMSQKGLAELLQCSQSQVAKYEAGKLMTPAVRRTVESLLTIADDGHPPWLVPYLQIEQEAASLWSWQPPVVPGLLQTEDYACCVLRTASPRISPRELDQQVSARMARQEIWQRADRPPPTFATVIGMAALMQMVGSAPVMRGQLDHLAEMADHPSVSIQILPFRARGSVGLLPAFVLAAFDDPDRPRTAYLDDAVAGRTTEKRDVVAQLTLIADALTREAERPGESIDTIRKAAAEW